MGYGVIILAAGNGIRMQSKLPKVLHKIAGQSMLERLVTTAHSLSLVQQIIVVGGENLPQLQQSLANYDYLLWAHQRTPMGTADAVASGCHLLSDRIKQVVVLSGDTPLISKNTLTKLLNSTKEESIGIVTANLAEPFGYGRIVRDINNNFLKITEEVDANELEQQITEINTGVYLFPKDFLMKFLDQINANNNKKEYYLTDIMQLAVKQNIIINSEAITESWEKYSINTRKQLIELEREFQLYQALKLLDQGVTILDPKRIDIRGTVTIAKDVLIDINVILEGKVIIETGVTIGSNCYIKDAIIGANTVIEPNSVIVGTSVGNNAVIGPFARIRPGTNIGAKSKIGNFVEIKATNVGEYSKINHLSYIGDANIGDKVNIGAGTITCNYDGLNKYITTIEDNVMVGSGSQLIAPIVVNRGAFIAAGTTLINDAPSNQLTLNKKLQYSKELAQQDN